MGSVPSLWIMEMVLVKYLPCRRAWRMGDESLRETASTIHVLPGVRDQDTQSIRMHRGVTCLTSLFPGMSGPRNSVHWPNLWEGASLFLEHSSGFSSADCLGANPRRGGYHGDCQAQLSRQHPRGLRVRSEKIHRVLHLGAVLHHAWRWAPKQPPAGAHPRGR